jgi:hypothetical protein
MKKPVFLLLFLLPFSISNAQVDSLIGNWTLIERNQIDFGSFPKITTEAQLKAEGQFMDYSFTEDGKFKQRNKFRDEDTLIFKGTWKIQDCKVILTMPQNGKDFVIDWTYELNGNTLLLSRYGLNGKDKMKLTLRGKQVQTIM